MNRETTQVRRIPSSPRGASARRTPVVLLAFYVFIVAFSIVGWAQDNATVTVAVLIPVEPQLPTSLFR